MTCSYTVPHTFYCWYQALSEAEHPAIVIPYNAGAVPSDLPAQQGIDLNLSNKKRYSNTNQSITREFNSITQHK